MMNSVTILLSVLFTLCRGQQNVNDQCQVARSGAAGICRSIEDCPVVLQEYFNMLDPTICGYKDRDQIVCCPLPPTPKPTKPTLSNRISAKKCAEYQDAVYERVNSWVGIGGPPVEQKIFRCSISTVPLIVGGENALPKEFPHMALIGFESNTGSNSRPGDKNISWKCGGTLISENYVLTAAHCMYAHGVGPATHILLGDLNYESDLDDAQPRLFRVVERIKRDDFKLPSKYNDIALIKFDGPVKFNNYIRPACLPQSKEVDTERIIASGWGRVEHRSNVSTHLQKVVLEVFSTEECNISYYNDIGRQLSRGIVHDTQLCAGSHLERKDTCQGDSGGPVQNYHPSVSCMYTVVGVTSFGKICGTQSVPGVYTRVYSYLDWIESIVWPNGA